jgi:hypothetical protein
VFLVSEWLTAAKCKEFEVLVLDKLSRFSRDLVDDDRRRMF